MALPVISTYRLQLRGESSGFAFTFADAENLLDYLERPRGVAPVSVPDHDRDGGIEPRLRRHRPDDGVARDSAAATGLARLSAAARARGMGLIVDIVPNHVGIDQPAAEPVVVGRPAERPFFALRNVSSTSTGISTTTAASCLPVLGSDDDAADLTVDGDLLRLGDLAFPIAPGTAGGTGPEVHDRQHYRLVGWRNGVCGYRRFFSITSLAGLRQEDRAVFDASSRRGRPVVHRGARRRHPHRPPRRIVRPVRISGVAARTGRPGRPGS